MKRITFAVTVFAAAMLCLAVGVIGWWKLAASLSVALATLASLSVVRSQRRAKLRGASSDNEEAATWYQDQGMVFFEGKPFEADGDEPCGATH